MQKGRKRSKISRRQQIRRRQRNRRILLAVVAAVVVIFGGVYISMYKYVHETADTKACENIYIGPDNVSGLDEAEIRELLDQHMDEYRKIKLKLSAEDKSVKISLGKLGFVMSNEEELIQRAISYGKEGSIWKRYQEIHKLEEESVVLDPEYILGEDAAEVLDEKTEKLERKAINASVKHTGDSFAITEEINGRQVDVEKTQERILTALNDGWEYKTVSIDVVVESWEPEITAKDLESIQDVLGSFYTVAGGGTRLQNLQRAAELLNGTIVMPGEEISVEALTKPYTTDNGYVEGTAYENGQIVTSVGGGLCQVSTTLYNALLYAEVEMVERCAHSMQVHYVDPSRDAAIAEGVKDLIFKNNYDTPILIEGYVDGSNYLRFYVYGKETRPENRSVEYESEVLEHTEYKTKYVADTESAIGSMIKEGTGLDGMVAKLWKVVYEDGKEVSRKTMNNSTYKASTVTMKVGVASDNKEAAALVKEAIETQKESKIENAISKAQKLIAEAEAEEEEEKDEETNKEDEKKENEEE